MEPVAISAGKKNEDADTMSIFLLLRSSASLKVEFFFSMNNFNNNLGLITTRFDETFGSGYPSFIKRETVLTSFLAQGSLMIDVMIKPALATPPFIPDNPLTCRNIQSLWFMDVEYADVVFEIAPMVRTSL